ncbi:MAG: ferric reductase-like transmembrane domain-containing protein [Anaerolineaceae bacterium]|nr:ferric reductase-like transmembrane domain-containing protein [Anaerolineaceae bacterium]
MSDGKSFSIQSHSPAPRYMNALTMLGWLGGTIILVTVFMVATLLMQAPVGSSVTGFLSWLFAADSVQVMWFITRAAGFTAYILIWLSVAWGLAVSNKILDHLLHRQITYDFHQFISLLAIGFLLLHIGILLFDRYLPYSVLQILVPFLSPYRPLWVGIGVIAFYLTLLVTVTYYLRGRIGMKAFRSIHVLSLVAYLGASIHGFFSGTDSSLISVQYLYAGTFLATVFLMVYWLIFLAQKHPAGKPGVVPQKSAPDLPRSR